MSKTKATLNEMAQLTMLTGRISEVHYKNLQTFPFIFFHGVAEVALDYAIATNRNEESLVTYALWLRPDSPNDHLDRRYKGLENAVRTLFWNEVKVEIRVNGDSVYKSE